MVQAGYYGANGHHLVQAMDLNQPRPALQPLFTSFALDASRDAACQLIVTLQARGVEVDSNRLRVKISWDGKWSDDADDMARHMVVEEV